MHHGYPVCIIYYAWESRITSVHPYWNPLPILNCLDLLQLKSPTTRMRIFSEQGRHLCIHSSVELLVIHILTSPTIYTAEMLNTHCAWCYLPVLADMFQVPSARNTVKIYMATHISRRFAKWQTLERYRYLLHQYRSKNRQTIET